ncbi:MAG: glycosyl hydrolase [Bryobacteraceae bacterium]
MDHTTRTPFRFGILLLVSLAAMAQRPWQQMTAPTVREAAANFRFPPREYGAIHWAIWGGELTKERIVQEFDSLYANGVYIVNFGPARGMTPKYLSPEYFDLIKFAVEEARKRGMKVWIADEGTYPSGFAGGLIKEKFPRLAMQGIVADMRVSLTAGQTISMPLPPDTLGMYIENGKDHTTTVLPMPKDGHLTWTAPNTGSDPYTPNWLWDVVFVRHVYRSSPTRYINRADGTYSKDALYPMIDYLDPDATRAFMSTTHEVYKRLFGADFGSTVLGFFGDEPDYASAIPWTPKLLDEFRKQKGYDLQPYLPLFFASTPTEEARRVKADYYDVWSGIFRDSFFGVQADWCARNNLDYLVHLVGEEVMMHLTRTEGDYFRDERHVQVPGIDNLSQLLPLTVHIPDGKWDVNNNFPKLASSAAHLFGRTQVWAEEGGGLGIDGKFQLDFQLVRGVNAMQLRLPLVRDGMSYQPGASKAGQVNAPPQAPMLAWYTNRAGYLMAIGRPAAQVGLYHPANSMWMGDEEADRSTTKLGWQLLEHQVDWDYFDEQSLSSVATIADGGFKNLSGQVYRAIVVPSSLVITKTGLERFQAFVKAGGKLIFVGKTPTLVVDKTFLDAKGTPDLSFATLIEPSGDITPRVLAALPKPDVKLDSPWQRLTYTHRSWRDGEMYFFFNESNKEESRMATVAGRGQAQVWDLGSERIRAMSGATAENDSVRFPLVLEPYEAKVVVVGPLPAEARDSEPSLVSGTTLAELDGDWTLDLNGKHLTTPLKSWEDLGTQSFVGPAIYHKQFTAPTVPAGKHVYLEIANVNEYAYVRVNGAILEARAWQPYRWDITSSLQPGNNDLQINVFATPSGRGGGGAVPTGAAPAAAGGRAGQVGPTGSATALRLRGVVTPPVSGLLGPVRLVAR